LRGRAATVEIFAVRRSISALASRSARRLDDAGVVFIDENGGGVDVRLGKAMLK
jgi:hypothetical protein